MNFLSSCSYEFRTPKQAFDVLEKIFSQYPELLSSELALWELMINAVEHGILGISFDTKAELLFNDTVEIEIENRLNSNRYANRSANIEVKELDSEYVVQIKDDGDGFDPSVFLNKDLRDIKDMHGRGILISKKTCKDITYHDKGNKVVVVFDRVAAN